MWFVVANITAGHGHLREGARVVVVDENHGNGGHEVKVRGRSKGGRVVTTWILAKWLRDARAAWVHGETGGHETKERAAEVARVIGAHGVGHAASTGGVT